MKKVYLMLSGGVDSAVAGLLLKESGYDVIGVFIKTWTPPFMPCTQEEERKAALYVAASLGIQFETLDLSKEYKKNIVDHMIKTYSSGATPNPDVLCNKEIKFGAFAKYILEKDKDAYIATGHHARVEKVSNRYFILRGKDKAKDQAYFLWMIDKDVLPQTLMPIGNLTKEEVRSIARKNDIFSANKKDSQGLCFMGAINMRDFLSHFIPLKEGKLHIDSGECIGIHPGAQIFTVGQRHGFTVTDKKYAGKTLYVVKKDVKKNKVFVSQEFPTMDEIKIINLKDINLFADLDQKEYVAETRYHGEKRRVRVLGSNKNSMKIEFLDDTQVVAKGQSVVLYKDDLVIAGGVVS